MQSIQEPPRPRALTAEDYQIVLDVERFRCPEVLFQPGMLGEYQAGLNEMVSLSLNRLPNFDSSIKDHMCQSILVTGNLTSTSSSVPPSLSLSHTQKPCTL
jgi:actin-related protein 5